MPDPLFRWPGGKRWLVPIIKPHLPPFDRYIEPFLGSGAILFALAPKRSLVADVNRDLIDCYRAIQASPEVVLATLSDLPSGEESYYWVRDDWSPQSLEDAAARFIYLLQHSWNGIYRVNQQGDFNVPYSYRARQHQLKSSHLLAIQAILENTELLCQDFRETLKAADTGDLIFLDPPYISSNGDSFRRYTSDTFDRADQTDLFELLADLDNRQIRWMMTIGELGHLLDQFPNSAVFTLTRNSSIAANTESRGSTSEHLVLSDHGAFVELIAALQLRQ